MPLATGNRVHQRGKAIDLFVIDIDGNGKFDKQDLTILARTDDEMDKNNPEPQVGVGLYE